MSEIINGRSFEDPDGLLATALVKFIRDLFQPNTHDGTLPVYPNDERWKARVEASIFGKDLDRLLAQLPIKPGEKVTPLNLLLKSGYEIVGIFHKSVMDSKLAELKIDSSNCVTFHIWSNDLLVVDQDHPKGITRQTGYKLVLSSPAPSPDQGLASL